MSRELNVSMPVVARALLLLFGQSSQPRRHPRPQFIIVFVSRGQPLRGPVGKDFLQKRGAAPLIKIVSFPRNGSSRMSSAARRAAEGKNLRRVASANSVPIFHTSIKFLVLASLGFSQLFAAGRH